MLDLFSHYPLPSPTSEPDESYIHIRKILRRLSKQNNPTFTSIAALDDIGLKLDLDIDSRDYKGLPGHSGPITDLRSKLILWALKVVECERLELPDLGDPSLVRQCLYMHSFAPNQDDENWIFEQFDIPEGLKG